VTCVLLRGRRSHHKQPLACLAAPTGYVKHAGLLQDHRRYISVCTCTYTGVVLQYGCPTPREGHACASWGDNLMIMFGGWGGGIRNDLYILQRSAQVKEDLSSRARLKEGAPSG
jgi:hypothetical protein